MTQFRYILNKNNFVLSDTKLNEDIYSHCVQNGLVQKKKIDDVVHLKGGYGVYQVSENVLIGGQFDEKSTEKKTDEQLQLEKDINKTKKSIEELMKRKEKIDEQIKTTVLELTKIDEQIKNKKGGLYVLKSHIPIKKSSYVITINQIENEIIKLENILNTKNTEKESLDEEMNILINLIAEEKQKLKKYEEKLKQANKKSKTFVIRTIKEATEFFDKDTMEKLKQKGISELYVIKLHE